MAFKRTAYISDAGEKALCLSENGNFSGRVNSILIRYENIMEQDCPELSVKEWMMICNMLNGTLLDTDYREADPARFLWADISESGRLDEMRPEWKIDTEDLSQRVRAMNHCQLYAILEVAYKFWNIKHQDTSSYAAILKSIGAKIKAES